MRLRGLGHWRAPHQAPAQPAQLHGAARPQAHCATHAPCRSLGQGFGRAFCSLPRARTWALALLGLARLSALCGSVIAGERGWDSHFEQHKHRGPGSAGGCAGGQRGGADGEGLPPQPGLQHEEGAPHLPPQCIPPLPLNTCVHGCHARMLVQSWTGKNQRLQGASVCPHACAL